VTAPIDAFFLPGLEERDVERWEIRSYGPEPIALRFPILRAGAITWVADRLKQNRADRLADLSLQRIIESIGAAALRLADPADPLRILAETSLPAITGYSPPMIRLVLDRTLRDWSTEALQSLIEREFPGGELDGFREHGHSTRQRSPSVSGGTVRTRAVGPGLTFHICSGNVPGVAVTSIVRSLLVRSAALAKSAAGEPLLAVLFARALSEIEPAVANAVAVTHWTGGQSRVEGEALHAADLVVVYGGEEAVRSIRTRAPVRTRIVEHGPRASVGMIGRASLASEAAAMKAATRAAWAIALFDQQGCVSPQVIWTEAAPISTSRFCQLLGEALTMVQTELPRGALDASEAAAIRDIRTRAEFRAIDGDDIELFEGEAVTWTVLRDGNPAFTPTCLNRTVAVKEVARLEHVMELIAPFRGFIQSVAMDGVGERAEKLAAGLAEAGATRITTFRNMPWPPPTWHHDGAGPLREMVTWIDFES